jgi:hypothetical protein
VHMPGRHTSNWGRAPASMYVNMYVVLCVGPEPAGNASQKYCARGVPSALNSMSRSVYIRSEDWFWSAGKPLASAPTTQHTPSGLAPGLHRSRHGH